MIKIQHYFDRIYILGTQRSHVLIGISTFWRKKRPKTDKQVPGRYIEIHYIPKTNMEPENNAVEKEKQLQTTNFWVPY